METILATLVVMTLAVTDTRPKGGCAKATRSAITKPIDGKRSDFPLLDHAPLCQTTPRLRRRHAKGAKIVLKGRGAGLRRNSTQQAQAPRKARVSNASKPKAVAKLTGKQQKKKKKKKKNRWVPERVFVRPSVGISR
ncbi:MAG: hypothetical protein JRH20_11180 [Deltaproteobacteria bacterium]|nr:hypothetical protein [Deltaproteobacteria bacterium]